MIREGFASVEELAAVPDAGLREIRHVGRGAITEVRDVIAAARTVNVADDQVVTLSGGQARELASLLATLAVYAAARNQHDVARRAEAFSIDVLGV